MMVCLGLSTQFPSVETILTALQDEFLLFRKTNVAIIFRIVVCSLGFLLGIPMTTEGGFYVLELLDIFVGFPLLIVGFFEIVSIIWVYGFNRFSEDVLMMVGYSSSARCLFYWYYSWNWVFLTPTVLLGILFFECFQYTPITSPPYPPWAEVLGWTVVFSVLIWTPVWYTTKAFIMCRRSESRGFCRICKEMNQPTDKWGPRNSMDRLIERYHRIRSDASSGRSGLILQPPSFKSSTSSAYLPKPNYTIRDSILGSDPNLILDN
ncbi:Sodium- and chloride-dependent glycine transporter 2 [Bulinus truncatus]|nr:Sodium- and chloride-dependent glycine transporter 2 [Bulinus truncatus]